MILTEEFIENCCEVMHDAYEKAAVGAGWETNPASRKSWADVPEANKVTMRAAVGALLEYLQLAGRTIAAILNQSVRGPTSTLTDGMPIPGITGDGEEQP